MNVTRIRPDNGLYDISVCVAVGREGLFEHMALPSIMAARPKEILVATGDGLASAKWNTCVAQASSDVCFICADDFYVHPRIMEYFVGALTASPNASVAYAHHLEVDSPMTGVFVRAHNTKLWSAASLIDGNHIGVYAFRKSHVNVPFDPEMARYEDWDLMLRLTEEGKFGIQIPEIMVVALFTGNCISKPDGEVAARQKILDKHKGLA